MKYFALNFCILFFMTASTLCAQHTRVVDPMNIYVFKHRYEGQAHDYINANLLIKEIDLFPKYMIDPNNRGTFDFKRIRKYIFEMYPNKYDSAVLCINIENKLFHNLRTEEKESKLFEQAVSEFTKMISLIRDLRPNLKIGIYGIPFRTYHSSQLKFNTKEKFDRILELTDVIFPSLYVLYPDKEHGVDANNNYFETNLDTAFDYADRLNKTVIPFVWYIVHTNNKRYGGELLGKYEMKRYLDFINNYCSNGGNSVDGVVWWETPTPFRKNQVLQASHLKREAMPLDNNQIFTSYVRYWLNER